METKRLRLSSSLLALWDRGDIDGAVATYCHLDRPISQAMKEGKMWHEKLSKYVDKNKHFPSWLDFKHTLHTPETEKEVVVNYNEYFDIKGYYDIFDKHSNVLFEFKTGKSDSLSWTRKWQLPIYFLMADIMGLAVPYGILIHYNQHDDISDYTVVHNTKTQRDYAANIIDSLGPEIRNFFLQEGLI